jgi:hypothetical protein
MWEEEGILLSLTRREGEMREGRNENERGKRERAMD